MEGALVGELGAEYDPSLDIESEEEMEELWIEVEGIEKEALEDISGPDDRSGGGSSPPFLNRADNPGLLLLLLPSTLPLSPLSPLSPISNTSGLSKDAASPRLSSFSSSSDSDATLFTLSLLQDTDNESIRSIRTTYALAEVDLTLVGLRMPNCMSWKGTYRMYRGYKG